MEKSIPSNLHAETIAIPDIGYATLQGLTIIIFFGGNDFQRRYFFCRNSCLFSTEMYIFYMKKQSVR